MRGLDPRQVTSAFFAGGARLLQIRQKSGSSAELLDVVRCAVAEAAPHQGKVIVNDRADVAAIAGAAGVHVGQFDLPVSVIREIAGADAICGLSTHTTTQVDEALAGSADYIAVGPVFRTGTKDAGYEPTGVELVRYAARKGKPIVAIGGVTLDRAEEVLAAGASAVAVISDLLRGSTLDARVRAFLERLPPQPFHV